MRGAVSHISSFVGVTPGTCGPVTASGTPSAMRRQALRARTAHEPVLPLVGPLDDELFPADLEAGGELGGVVPLAEGEDPERLPPKMPRAPVPKGTGALDY
jgi:hypothetical protein